MHVRVDLWSTRLVSEGYNMSNVSEQDLAYRIIGDYLSSEVLFWVCINVRFQRRQGVAMHLLALRNSLEKMLIFLWGTKIHGPFLILKDENMILIINLFGLEDL